MGDVGQTKKTDIDEKSRGKTDFRFGSSYHFLGFFEIMESFQN